MDDLALGFSHSWDFSKHSELCRPEPGAGVWAGLSPSSSLGMGARRHLHAFLWRPPYPPVFFGGYVHLKTSLSG